MPPPPPSALVSYVYADCRHFLFQVIFYCFHRSSNLRFSCKLIKLKFLFFILSCIFFHIYVFFLFVEVFISRSNNLKFYFFLFWSFLKWADPTPVLENIGRLHCLPRPVLVLMLLGIFYPIFNVQKSNSNN